MPNPVVVFVVDEDSTVGRDEDVINTRIGVAQRVVEQDGTIKFVVQT